MHALLPVLLAAFAVQQPMPPPTEARGFESAHLEAYAHADLFIVPFGADTRELSLALLAEERLTSGDGVPHFDGADVRGVHMLAMTAGDGRTVHITYRTAQPDHGPAQVCRVRSRMNGVSDAAWEARRWCAAHFGIQLPVVPPPPILVSERIATIKERLSNRRR